MLAAVQRGDLVIASKMDRMFRNTTDALTVAKQLADQGVRLVLRDISTDPINNGHGVGEFVFTLLAAVATMERTRIAERMQEGKAAKLARGGHAGGIVPFGYKVVGKGKDAVRVPIPEEQAVIAHARQLRAGGATLRAVQAAVLAGHGKHLSLDAISRVTA